MPTTRAQALRDAVLQRNTAHNEVANPLTSELIDLIIKALPRSDLAAVRLASTQFAAAVDPLIKAVTIRTTSHSKGASLHVPTNRMQHVRRATVHSSCGHEHAVLRHLPQLNTVLLARPDTKVMPHTLAASLVHLTRLDVTSWDVDYLPSAASGVQLPGLRVLSVAKGLHSSIAAFAPNLQELYCHWLQLTIPAAPLPACTHFGATYIDLTQVTSAADALAAFSAALPKVQVVSRVPIQVIERAQSLSVGSFLEQDLPFLHAARADTAAFSPAGFEKLRGLTNLQRLHAADHYTGMQISSLTQLQHLRLVFGCLDGRSPVTADLFQGLGMLHNLVTLELPAWLLCQQCLTLSGSDVGDNITRVQQGLKALAASSSLQSLMFLRGRGVLTCAHGNHTPAAVAGLTTAAGSGAAAAAAAAEQQGQAQQQAQQQPVKVQLRTLDDSRLMEPWLYSHDSSKSVWGTYGPPDWENLDYS